MAEPIFELNNVNYSYLGKYPALRDINIKIEKGQKVSIIGANGSGKSTLLHILDGLIFPDQGSVAVSGSVLTDKSFTDLSFSRDFRKKIGLVFQNPDVQLFCPTVKEDILFGPLQLGIEKTRFDKRLEELVAMLDLKDLLNRSPHQLSIGEKRKVAIASSLIIEPEVLLLDEPTAGLDPLTTRYIIDMLIQANTEGKTIIISTHDLHIIEEISDIVHVFSRDKTIVKSGKPIDILKDTQLLQDNNLVHIHKHIHDGKVHVHPHQHIDDHHH